MEHAISEVTKCFNRALNAYDQVLKDRDNEISSCKTNIYRLESENKSLKAEIEKLKGAKP